MYLLENNHQVRQFVKFAISSTSRTHVRDLPRPASVMKTVYFVVFCTNVKHLYQRTLIKKSLLLFIYGTILDKAFIF